MGCTPSTPNRPDGMGTGSTMVFTELSSPPAPAPPVSHSASQPSRPLSRLSYEKRQMRDTSPNTFTSPSIGELQQQYARQQQQQHQQNHRNQPQQTNNHSYHDLCHCGRLFGISLNCCHRCIRSRDMSDGGRHRHKPISASLTGLNSIEPESNINAMTEKAMTEKMNFPTCLNWKHSIKLGRMKLESNKRAKVLLVLNKADTQANTLQLAAERVEFEVRCVDSAEAALNAFDELQPEIVIIDARNAPFPTTTATTNAANVSSSNFSSPISAGHVPAVWPTLDAASICKSIRNVKSSEFTCILALVPLTVLERDHGEVIRLLQSGFNRCIEVTDHLGHCVSQFLQLREFELPMQRRLRAANALLSAIDSCKDGVVITGPRHEIQFANNSIEKMFGFRLEDMMGKKAQDYFHTELIKSEVDQKINNFNEGKDWEGQIYHRRKSGESLPIWNRILPVNYHNGSPEFIIYVKEFPYLFIDKLASPEIVESAFGLKGFRKASLDVKSEVRRPSLAKFNSVSLIEAPLTRVINILIAIKESSPNYFVPTLERAIDILNSEIFMPQFQSYRPNDQLTSELVSSLINTNNPGVRRMSHEAASNKSSLSMGYPQTPPVTQPCLSNVPANIQALLDHDLSWNFNVIELERITHKRPLAWLGLSILNRFNVCQTLQCSETTLRNWLTLIEANYHDNPYHNSTHAADVMQATAHFLMCSRLKSVFDPLDQAICLIAAIIHDIDHPGRNSAFLCNSSHELAILYNDISVLESHHAARGFKLTIGPGNESVNIFKKLDSDMYRDVRQSVIDMVLATDMTKHFEHLTKFVNVFQTMARSDSEMLLQMEEIETGSECAFVATGTNSSGNQLDSSSQTASVTIANNPVPTPEEIVLIKRMLIKCADVSNPARSLKLCQTWAERISTEYCDQTDEEKKGGLPVVMPTFDRLTCSIPKSQIGFIDYFAYDMFEAWHAFGDFIEIVENMSSNYQYWKDQLNNVEVKHKKLSLEGNVNEDEEDKAKAAGNNCQSTNVGQYSSVDVNHVEKL